METSQTDINKSSSVSLAKAESFNSPADQVRKYNDHAKKLFHFKKNIPDNIFRRLQLDLLKVSKALGIQNPPDEKELTQIILFLMNNFAEFTPQEIYHAFELFAAGKINTIEEAGKTRPIERPFGTFNFIFIGQVLNGYRAYRKPILQKAEEEKLIEESTARDITQMCEEEWNSLNFHIINKFVHDNKSVPLTGDFAAAFLYLEKQGLLKITNEEKLEFLNKYRDERIQILMDQKSMNPFKRFEIDREIQELSDDRSPELIRQVRARAANIYFNQILIDIKNENKKK